MLIWISASLVRSVIVVSWALPIATGWSARLMPPDALRHVGQWHDLLLGAGSEARLGTEAALAEILVTTHMPCLIVPGRAAMNRPT